VQKSDISESIPKQSGHIGSIQRILKSMQSPKSGYHLQKQARSLRSVKRCQRKSREDFWSTFSLCRTDITPGKNTKNMNFKKVKHADSDVCMRILSKEGGMSSYKYVVGYIDDLFCKPEGFADISGFVKQPFQMNKKLYKHDKFLC
jgi:hypothetical protein